MERKVEIIVGTNEEYVLGYQVIQQKDGKVSLHQVFADHSHNGSVRQVAVGGKMLASGATDEMIRIFNLATRTEVGIIMEHQGTISSLAFYGESHLFSTAEDGNICIYKQGKWQCKKTLRGHRGGVVSLAVHPSGKMALSVGRDNTLRTWNLIKGRKAYITKLKTESTTVCERLCMRRKIDCIDAEGRKRRTQNQAPITNSTTKTEQHFCLAAEGVYWNPKGTKYLIVKGSCVDIYEVSSGLVEHSIDFKEHISSLTFVTDDIIAVGGEGKNICLYDVATNIEMGQWAAHTSRIKCLCSLPGLTSEELWLVSASSDGMIKIWSLELLSLTSQPKLLGEVNTTCRVICMDVYLPPYMPSLDIEPEVSAEYASSEEEKKDEEEDEEDDNNDNDKELEDTKNGKENDDKIKGNTERQRTSSNKSKLKRKNNNKNKFSSSTSKEKRIKCK